MGMALWGAGRCGASYNSAGGSEGGSLIARPLGGRALKFSLCCDFSPATGKVTGLFHWRCGALAAARKSPPLSAGGLECSGAR